MPEILCTTVYQFPELSDAAKEKARGWYREAAFTDDWWDAVYDDFERICAILGVDLKTRPVRLMGGGARVRPCTASPSACRRRSGGISISSVPRCPAVAATTTNTA